MVSVQIFGHMLRAAVDESEIEVPVTGQATVTQLIEANPAQLGACFNTSRAAKRSSRSTRKSARRIRSSKTATW